MKKTTLFALGFVVCGVASEPSFARGRVSDGFPRPPQLTEVSWSGIFGCEEKQHGPGHEKNHRCDLQFVNSDTGESWNVRDNPALSALHLKYNGAVPARIEAKSSPRYLLGGSYVDVQRITVLSNEAPTSPSATSAPSEPRAEHEDAWSRR